MRALSPEAKEALLAARRRYRRLPLTRRPALGDPVNCLGLFAPEELVELAKCGWWPLPGRVLDWLAAPPRRSRKEPPTPPGREGGERFRQGLLDLATEQPDDLRRLLAAVLWPRKGVSA